MKTHDLKTWPEPFEAVWRGEKHHEVRVDDRSFAVGDELLLREWDPKTETYSNRGIQVRVTHITREPFVPAPLCVMSFQHVHVTGKLCCSATGAHARDPDSESRNLLRGKLGLTTVLHRISSWTCSRFDQHLRFEVGDDATDALLDWLAEHVNPSLSREAILERVHGSGSKRTEV